MTNIEILQLSYDLMRYESGYVYSSEERLTVRNKFDYSLKDGVDIEQASVALEDYKKRYAKEIEVARDSCGVMMPTIFCKHSDFKQIKENTYYSLSEMNIILAKLYSEAGDGTVECVVKSNYNKADLLPVELSYCRSKCNQTIEAALLDMAAKEHSDLNAAACMAERIEDCRYTIEARRSKEDCKKKKGEVTPCSEVVAHLLDSLLNCTEMQEKVKAEIEVARRKAWEKAVEKESTKLTFEAWKKAERIDNDCGEWKTITDIPEIAFDIAIRMRHKK